MYEDNDKMELDESINSKVRRGVSNSDYKRIVQNINWVYTGQLFIPGSFLWFRHSDKGTIKREGKKAVAYKTLLKNAETAFKEDRIKKAINGGLLGVTILHIDLENPKYFQEITKQAEAVIKNPLAKEYTEKTHILSNNLKAAFKTPTLSAANFFKYNMQAAKSSKKDLSAKDVANEMKIMQQAFKESIESAKRFKTMSAGFEKAYATVKKAKESGKISTKQQDYAITNINDARNVFFQSILGQQAYEKAIVRRSFKNLNNIYKAADKKNPVKA